MFKFRVDFYTHPHKDFRKMLFQTAILAGEIDYCDDSQLQKLQAAMNETLLELRSHARHENTYAHPIVASKIPSMRRQLEIEHAEHNEDIDNLELQFATLFQSDLLAEKKQKMGLEFYRSFNRFIAEYLLHLNEEEYSMQNLWELCTAPELFSVMIAYKANEEPEEFAQIFSLAKANLDAKEMEYVFNVIQKLHGESIFAKSKAAALKCA